MHAIQTLTNDHRLLSPFAVKMLSQGGLLTCGAFTLAWVGFLSWGLFWFNCVVR